jgi:hypothetical protein
MGRARSKVLWFLAASLLAHGLWLLTLPTARPRSTGRADHEVEFSLVSEPVAQKPLPPTAAESKARKKPGRRPGAVVKLAPPSAAEMPARSEPPSPATRAETPDPGPELATQERVPPAQSDRVASGPVEAARAPAETSNEAPSPPQPSAAGGKPPDLSAHAAALSFNDLSAAPSSVCNPRMNQPAGVCASTPTEASRNDELRRSLQTAARAVPHLAPREPPHLQRQADGSYRYDGHVFQANVGLDGEVAFEDAAQLHANPLPLGGGFDLYDAIEKHVLKKELYSAEKTWFLEQTVALREELATQFRASEWSRTKRALERELDRIFAADSGMAEKHAAIIALWENCGEDAEAAHVRALVEDFIRRRLPRGSSLAFSDDELRRVNRERVGMRAFDPYRT